MTGRTTRPTRLSSTGMDDDLVSPQQVGASGSGTCFVIGPIGDRLADPGTPERDTWEEAVRVLEEVIEPACREHKLEVIRADRISQPGEIPEQAFLLLRDADIV